MGVGDYATPLTISYLGIRQLFSCNCPNNSLLRKWRFSTQWVQLSHCSLLKAVRPESPNGVSPFPSFEDSCSWRHFPWFFRLFFPPFTVFTFQPLPPLPPCVRSSRATPNKVLSILSVVVGVGASNTLPVPPLSAVLFFFVLEGVDPSTRPSPWFF
jgi:hypothetical protein